MRQIDYIVIHCTATQPDTKVESIERYWREQLGWRSPGYHFIIEADGNIVQLQDVDKIANGVRGYNKNSIHLSYIGGIDSNGLPKDTRTEEQKDQMYLLVHSLRTVYPGAQIKGHREFPNVNKACPSFDVQEIRDAIY